MLHGADNLEDLKGTFNGERIFVIGNGPSLNKTPLEKLDSEHTLAMNKISSIYSDTEWRPSLYYFAMSPSHSEAPNTHHSDDYIGRNIELGIPCFINSEYRDIIGERENTYYFDKFKLQNENPFNNSSPEEVKNMPIGQLRYFWSDDISYHLYHYHTMYGALQTAVYLGFEKIYLLGCDLGMEYVNPHMVFKSGLDPYRYDGDLLSYINNSIEGGKLIGSICNAVMMEIIKKLGDSRALKGALDISNNSHFTENYLDAVGIDDGVRVGREIEKTHIAAKTICDRLGVEIYNATVGGELEVYERVNMHSLVDH